MDSSDSSAFECDAKFENNSEKNIICEFCNQSYRTRINANKHKVKVHNWNFYQCDICHVKAKLKETINRHKCLKHLISATFTLPREAWSKTQFSRPTYEFLFNDVIYTEVKSFFKNTKEHLFEKLLIDLSLLMVSDVVLFVEIWLETEFLLNCERVVEIKCFHKELKTVANAVLVADSYDVLTADLGQMVTDYKRSFPKKYDILKTTVISAKVTVQKWQRLTIDFDRKLPDQIVSKKAVSQVFSKDNYNFKWVLLSAFYNGKRHRCRMSSYRISDIRRPIINYNSMTLDFQGLEMPLPLRDLPKFEEANPTISLNVFGYELDAETKEVSIIGPLYRCKALKENHVNLLLIGKVESCNYRYALIRNMSRLINSQQSSHNSAIWLCYFCMKAFHKKEKLEKHRPVCSGILVPIINQNLSRQLEIKSSWHSYWHNRLPLLPFTVFANYECISVTDRDAINLHVCGFAFYIKCNFNMYLNVMHCDQGINCAPNFVENLIVYVSRLFVQYVYNKNSSETTSKKQMPDVTNCCICQKEVPDNERINLFYKPTKAFVGPCHKDVCSKYFHTNTYVPIFLPSLDDMELFSRHLDEYPGKLVITRNNEQQVTAVSKFVELIGGSILELRFLDLKICLDKNIDIISRKISFKDFKTMKAVIKSDNHIALMQEKLFPFAYVTSVEKLYEMELPDRQYFDCYGEQAYENAQEVWKAFKCQTLKDFLVVYLESEVLLQSDIFDFYKRTIKTSTSLKYLFYELNEPNSIK